MRVFCVLVLISLLGVSCDRWENDNCSDCDKALCTKEFKTIFIHVQDAVGNPLELDSFEVRLNHNRDLLINTKSASSPVGVYPLINDGHMQKLTCQGSNVTFTAYKTGITTTTHIYEVGKDCCHVQHYEKSSLVLTLENIH